MIRQKTGEPGTFDNMMSIRGGGEPLIVIDGVTREGTEELAQLNSEDIEKYLYLERCFGCYLWYELRLTA